MTACYAIETWGFRPAADGQLVRTPVGDRAADGLIDVRNVENVENVKGVSLLVSTGFCGALTPALRLGDLVLADVVRHRGDEIRISRELVDRARNVLDAAGLPVSVGPTESLSEVADRPTKERLAPSGAVAVDMESGPLARWAADRAIPFLSLRVVFDEWDVDVPFSAEDSLVRSVVRHPLAALRAGRWAARAGRKLGRALNALVPAAEEAT